MTTLFGENHNDKRFYKSKREEEQKEEKKKIKKEIKELEELICEYNIYLSGKKTCVLTNEQLKEDIKMAKLKVVLLKGILNKTSNSYDFTVECIEESSKLLSELFEKNKKNGTINITGFEMDEIINQAIKNVRERMHFEES